jgi:hypothetical protein
MAALGATHYRWRPDVQRVVSRVEAHFGRVKCNTYYGHPFPGWGSVSVDAWDLGGRGDPLPHDLGLRVLRFFLQVPNSPAIRHWIFEHKLWTSWGGVSYWRADDHDGWERHFHITYWK